MERLHSLLRRQIKKYFKVWESVPPEAREFVDAVDDAYRQFDEDRSLLERSLDLSSLELMSRNSEMRAMFQAFPDLFFRLDRNGTILDLNVSRSADLNLPARELPGKRVHDGLPNALGRELEKAIRRVAETGEIVSLEYPLTVPSGKNWWEARIVRNGETQVLMIVRDITERMRAREALRKSEEQLRQAQKMEEIGRLAGGVAHDFNNLLTTILGLSELVLSGLPKGRLAEDVRDIQAASRRAADLTQQLLTFSRRQVIAPKVVDFNDIALNITKMLRRVIGEDIELDCRIGSGLSKVRVDVGQMEQLILNLAVNARDAMPKGGRLTIETSGFVADEAFVRANPGAPAGEYARLTVSDTGTGMTAEVREHLFEPFFTTKEQGKGTGLGLATCYGIIKQNNGCVAVRSEPDRGASFDVYFPRVAETISPPAAEGPPELLARGSETILLVEDDPAVRRLAGRVLRSQGYTVQEASDGAEGLAAVSCDAEARLSLVITDVVMPKLGGKQLADAIGVSRPDIKIIFITGYTDDVMLSKGVLREGHVLVRKPFDLRSLTDKVREVLDA